MLYKIFLRSNFKISVLGFGTAPIGLSGYQNQSFNQIREEKESIKALERALELGINYFDTAPIYGNKIEGGKWLTDRASERMLGEVISKIERSKVFIATKSQAGWNSAKQIQTSLEESLRLLKTDYIDLYQIHGQSYRADNWKNLVTNEAIEVLQSFKKEGKIKFIGVSGYREGAFCAMIEQDLVDTIMPQYNIFYRGAEWELLQLANDNKVAVFPMRPATGREMEKFIIGLDPENKLNIDPYKIAIKYALSNPCVTSLPIGMRTVKEVEHNVNIIHELKEIIPGLCE